MTALSAVRPAFAWKPFFQRYGLLFSLVLLCVVLTLASPRFLTVDNLLNVLRQSSINGIIAIGMMYVILTRGIDLSVGSILALAMVIAADLLRNGGMNPLVAIGVGVAAGAVLGLINGALVAYLRIPPFIATLGMMVFARGAALQYTEGKPITGLASLGEGFRWLGSSTIAGVPTPIFAAALLYLLAYILLEHTPFGRFIFGMGDNEDAAYLSGLPVKRIKLFVYSLSGAMAALAGVILVGRLDSAQPSAGTGYEFDAIAAVVVGGTSLTAARGQCGGRLSAC